MSLDEETTPWDRLPNFDVPIAKVSSKASFPFDDTGFLRDPMDKKAEGLIRKAWESFATAFKPNIASACIARCLLVWLNQLEPHFQNKVPCENLLSFISTIKKSSRVGSRCPKVRCKICCPFQFCQMCPMVKKKNW